METDERLRRRILFNGIVDIYDAARPTYPDDLYADLLEFVRSGRERAHAGPSTTPVASALEVGSGTGQATRGLLSHGFTVTAIELGPEMAVRARANLEAFGDRLHILVGDFEQVDLPENSFDLVASASAFHWIDPEIGFPKVISLLKPGGAMAVWGMGLADEEADSQFGTDQRRIYEELGIPRRGHGQRSGGAGHPRAAEALAASGLFGPLRSKRYPVKLTYPRDQYLQLVASYSGFQVLTAEQQEALTCRLGFLIDSKYGGEISRTYTATLCMARPL